jgi:hypothetical protein
MAKYLACVFLLACFTSSAIAGLTADSKQVAEVENIYADLNDAFSIITTIDSGLFTSYRGKDRAGWDQVYREKRKEFSDRLAKLPSQGFSENDATAIAAMRKQFAAMSETISAPFSPGGKCQDDSRKDQDYASLRRALLVCFTENANNVSFEGGKINRQSVLDLLHEIEEPERRKAVFMALAPLWQAINGNNEPDSPYRRMIAMAAADAAKHGSEVDAAARDAGVNTADVEQWLEQILDAWRQVNREEPIEPWSFSYSSAEADRQLAAAIPRESLQPVNQLLPGPGSRPQTIRDVVRPRSETRESAAGLHRLRYPWQDGRRRMAAHDLSRLRPLRARRTVRAE